MDKYYFHKDTVSKICETTEMTESSQHSKINL